jgi:hypothetical protein
MDILFESEDNATPLSEEETQGLKQKWITLRSELNEMEMQNIIAAEKWLLSNTPEDILNEEFYKNCTKRCLELFGPGLDNFGVIIQIYLDSLMA